MWFVGIADLDTPSEIISLGGPYDWEFRREADGWKISRIVLSIWWQQGRGHDERFLVRAALPALDSVSTTPPTHA